MLLFIVFLLPRTPQLWSVSIHHMLLFIKSPLFIALIVCLFQYITCYSLSDCRGSDCCNCCRFNTSHVTLYRMAAGLIALINCVSIHHMLLFIIVHHVIDTSEPFQYITCYSLSGKGDDWCQVLFRFNTSHVTLYLVDRAEMSGLHKFQYITCYSLSLST